MAHHGRLPDGDVQVARLELDDRRQAACRSATLPCRHAHDPRWPAAASERPETAESSTWSAIQVSARIGERYGLADRGRVRPDYFARSRDSIAHGRLKSRPSAKTCDGTSGRAETVDAQHVSARVRTAHRLANHDSSR